MKLKPDDYAAIRAAVLDYAGRYPDAMSLYKQGGLSPMRFRWDLLRPPGYTSGHARPVPRPAR